MASNNLHERMRCWNHLSQAEKDAAVLLIEIHDLRKTFRSTTEEIAREMGISRAAAIRLLNSALANTGAITLAGLAIFAKYCTEQSTPNK